MSISNIRAAYAEASSEYLTGSSGGKVTVDPTAKTATIGGVVLKGTQSGWSGLDGELSFTHTTMTDAIGGTAGTYELVFEFDDAGACTLKTITKQ